MFKLINLIILINLYKCEKIFYYIKWITPNTKLPIIIDHSTEYGELYEWYKHYENRWINKNSQNGIYKTDFNQTHNRLEILAYDHSTHAQLDHYELKFRYEDDENTDEIDDSNNDIDNEDSIDTREDVSEETNNYVTFIYTLAYVKSIDMPIKEGIKYFNISCIVRFIVPLGISYEHTQFIHQQLRSRVQLDLNNNDINNNDDDNDDYKISKSKNRIKSKRDKNQDVPYYVENIDKRNKQKRDELRDLYVLDLEITVGPMSIYRIDQDQQIDENITCTLSLIDPDHSLIKKTLHKTVKQTHEGTNRSNKLYFNHIFIFMTVLIINFKWNFN